MPTIFSILSIDIYCLTPLSFFPNSAILSTIRLGRSRNFITMVKFDGFRRKAARRVDDMEGRAKLSFAEIK